jgi:hypothetical protein
MESVLQESPPTMAALWGTSQVDLLSLSLSLSFVKEGFSLGKLRKSSVPITAVRQVTQENSGAIWGLILDCQCYMGRAELQCPKAFFLSTLSSLPP